MLSRSGWSVVRLLLCCALLAGCQPDVRVPSPTASFRCTPEAGGAEFDCTPHEHDDMVAKDKLYTEAEAVYREFLTEEVRLLRLGGVDEPTPVLQRTAAGAFLGEVMDDLRSARANGVTVSEGSRSVEAVERVVGVSKGGSIAALSICVDSRTVRFIKSGKTAGSGELTRDDLYFGEIDGELKVIGADGRVVEEC
jgi:hypothetical protein